MKKPVSKKLFFVCPVCQMEQFIRKQFGDVYFVTSQAAIFDFKDAEFANVIRSFIKDRSITDVYVACDISCNFLNKSIHPSAFRRLRYEKVIENLRTPYDSAYTLAEKLVRQQTHLLKRNLELTAGPGDTKVHGLITSKSNEAISFVYTGSQKELFAIGRN